MAKYSREQRDRAVDLYIKYEHSAADTIWELGYPSRGALWMWYKDRLEEERTGIPSGRGERYRRYTDEQKRVAVEHYLEYGRRLSRTMRMLGYPKSKELLMAWIDEFAPGRRKLRHGPVPEELKREAVVAVASGRLKSREAAAELGVEASVVRNWKRQMLAGSKETHVTKERRGRARNGRAGAQPAGSDAPAAAGGSRGVAGLAEALASMERRLAEMQARLDELDAGIEARRRTERDLDVQFPLLPPLPLDVGVQLVQTGTRLRQPLLQRRHRVRQAGRVPRAGGGRRHGRRRRGLHAGFPLPGRRGLLSRCLRHVSLLGSGEHLPFPVSHDGRLHAQFGGRLA